MRGPAPSSSTAVADGSSRHTTHTSGSSAQPAAGAPEETAYDLSSVLLICGVLPPRGLWVRSTIHAPQPTNIFRRGRGHHQRAATTAAVASEASEDHQRHPRSQPTHPPKSIDRLTQPILNHNMQGGSIDIEAPQASSRTTLHHPPSNLRLHQHHHHISSIQPRHRKQWPPPSPPSAPALWTSGSPSRSARMRPSTCGRTAEPRPWPPLARRCGTGTTRRCSATSWLTCWARSATGARAPC